MLQFHLTLPVNNCCTSPPTSFLRQSIQPDWPKTCSFSALSCLNTFKSVYYNDQQDSISISLFLKMYSQELQQFLAT